MLTVGIAGFASGQSSSSCPYSNGLPTIPGCSNNPHPYSIPSVLGGSQITASNCAHSINEAIASLYAFDDVSCHQAGITVAVGNHRLKYVNDAAVYLPPNYREEARRGNFRGSFYCDIAANSLILAFKGSVSLTTLDRSNIEDWFDTNLLQHLGTRPTQYLVAQDIVWQIKEFWALGRFDDVCGHGRPNFILAGHSKGGGQAQFAAVRNSAIAIVFNSDPVNELIFTDWLYSPDAPEIVQRMLSVGRGVRSLYQCRAGQIDDELSRYIATGKIRDVRMINDIIAQYLLPHCNLPHAPIEWLIDTLSCSSGSVLIGHSIDTVVRELQVCAP